MPFDKYFYDNDAARHQFIGYLHEKVEDEEVRQYIIDFFNGYAEREKRYAQAEVSRKVLEAIEEFRNPY